MCRQVEQVTIKLFADVPDAADVLGTEAFDEFYDLVGDVVATIERAVLDVTEDHAARDEIGLIARVEVF